MLQMLGTYIADRLNHEEGASMVEYGLLVALIAVVVAVAATVLGDGIAGLFTTVNDGIEAGEFNAPAAP